MEQGEVGEESHSPNEVEYQSPNTTHIILYQLHTTSTHATHPNHEIDQPQLSKHLQPTKPFQLCYNGSPRTLDLNVPPYETPIIPHLIQPYPTQPHPYAYPPLPQHQLNVEHDRVKTTSSRTTHTTEEDDIETMIWVITHNTTNCLAT